MIALPPLSIHGFSLACYRIQRQTRGVNPPPASSGRQPERSIGLRRHGVGWRADGLRGRWATRPRESAHRNCAWPCARAASNAPSRSVRQCELMMWRQHPVPARLHFPTQDAPCRWEQASGDGCGACHRGKKVSRALYSVPIPGPASRRSLAPITIAIFKSPAASQSVSTSSPGTAMLLLLSLAKTSFVAAFSHSAAPGHTSSHAG